MRWTRLLVCLVTFAGCRSSDEQIQIRFADVPSRRLPVKAANISWPVWRTDNEIILSRDGGLGPTTHLVSTTLSNPGYRRLPLGSDPKCRVTEYLRPAILPQGKVGVVKYCPLRHDPSLEQRYFVLAFDPQTRTVERQVRSVLDFLPSTWGWNAQVGRGIGSRGDDTCATLLWFSSDGIDYPRVTLKSSGREVVLDQSLVGSRCGGEPRADWPTWSPDGSSIAFFASPQSVGVHGISRVHVPWNLYVADADLESPREVLADVFYPRSLAWAPNGRWLAFGGSVGEEGQGTWLFAPSTGDLVRVSATPPDWLAWSPSGREMAMVVDEEPTAWPLKALLVILDLSGLDESLLESST